MASAMPKSIYKERNYILGPKTGRVHLDEGTPPDQQPWWATMQDQAPPAAPPPPSSQLVPGMVGVTQDQLTAPPAPQPTPKAPAPTDDTESLLPASYNTGINQMKQLYGERPERTPAHWWQKALSGAVGGLAGWSNAAGRSRPIDVSQAVENIQHPGYAGKLQDWQSKVAQMQGPLDLEAQRQAAEMKAQQIGAQAESRLENAEARTQMSDPHHNREQLNPDFARENFPWMQPDAKGEFWVDKTVANTIQKPIPQGKQAVDRGEEVTDPDIATYLGKKVGEYVDRDLYKQALIHKNAMALAGLKPVNAKQDKTTLAMAAANGDKNAQKALDILATNTLKGKPAKAAAKGNGKFDPSTIPSGVIPLPQGGGKSPDIATAHLFLRQSNGDRAQAAQLMIQNGWKP